jgi:leucyl aminopeptidase
LTQANFKPTNFISLQTAALPAPVTEPAIQVAPASATPALGSPGPQTGDIHLSAAVDRPLIMVSLGKAEKIIRDTYRQAGGALAGWLSKRQIQAAGLDASELNHEDLAAFCEGLLLGGFKFEHYKKAENQSAGCVITIRRAERIDELSQKISRTNRLIEAVNLARDWAHEPANALNPVTLAERASMLADSLGLQCTVLDDTRLVEMGAGAITAVGKGSKTPSRMIVIEYPGKGAGAGKSPVALVGKAITFDTGGYSLKGTEQIQRMKFDKCGGLDVLAILKAAHDLEIETPLVGVICAAENMISGGSYRPDDILTSLSGKTIEVISTDAEGRLVLADGLTYALKQFHPRAIIDLATLTGGVVTALGRVRAGIFSNDDPLATQLITAGEGTHERLWRLPLDDDYFPNIKGDDADIKNSGGREAHPIMGAIFLKQFIDDGTPWAHLDIAGTADTPKDLPYAQKGATGFGVRLIVEYLEHLEN